MQYYIKCLYANNNFKMRQWKKNTRDILLGVIPTVGPTIWWINIWTYVVMQFNPTKSVKTDPHPPHNISHIIKRNESMRIRCVHYLIILLQELDDISGQCGSRAQEDIDGLHHHHCGTGNTEEAGEGVHHRNHGPSITVMLNLTLHIH